MCTQRVTALGGCVCGFATRWLTEHREMTRRPYGDALGVAEIRDACQSRCSPQVWVTRVIFESLTLAVASAKNSVVPCARCPR